MRMRRALSVRAWASFGASHRLAIPLCSRAVDSSQVRCAVCSAVTDLRTLNAPAPPQSAPAPSEPKSKARVEVAPEVNLDYSSSEEEAPKEKPRVEARDEEPIQLKPIVPPKVVEPVDPEYASDDEAVKVSFSVAARA